eukprot:GHVT01032391.1.p1 GENE.GHVT01032391.1~~GHVT01032391.1.p1  ORF type:complete len:585 (-),score=42.21 GHVT01032391.1:902-2569(-)
MASNTHQAPGRSEGLVTLPIVDEGVFCNPCQVFNRDCSIIVVKAFAEKCKDEIKQRSLLAQERCSKENRPAPPPLEFQGFSILEPLAATGLRSLRYCKELSDLVYAGVAGDLDSNAVQQIRANAKHNNVDNITVVCSDANRLMHLLSRPCDLSSGVFKKINCLPAGCKIPSWFDTTPPTLPEGSLTFSLTRSSGAALVSNNNTDIARKELPSFYDVIDIDPYGSSSEFLDGAVQAVRSGGLLCLTSTDMATLCGNAPEVSFYKYGGTAIKARYLHEMALRLLLHATSAAAARHQRVITPLISLSVDFYIRVFVQVKHSAESCKFNSTNTSLVFQCDTCDCFRVVPLGGLGKSGQLSKNSAAEPTVSVSEKPDDGEVSKEPAPESTVSVSEEPDNGQVSKNLAPEPKVSVSEEPDDGAVSMDPAPEPTVSVTEEPNASVDADKARVGKKDSRTRQRYKFRAPRFPKNIHPTCSQCGGSYIIGGPFYSGPLYDAVSFHVCQPRLRSGRSNYAFNQSHEWPWRSQIIFGAIICYLMCCRTFWTDASLSVRQPKTLYQG